MSMHRGRMPKPDHAVRYHAYIQAWILVIAVVVTGAMTAQSAFAQQAVPLSLQEAEELALYDEPGQNSYLSRAAALRDEAVAGSQLPDPTMRVGMLNFPIESGGFRTEGMTQAQLGFRQEFPAGKTRELTSRKFKAMARAMTYTADGRGRDVLTAVRIAWLETHYWRKARQITMDSRPFFDDLVSITRSLYSVGRKNQQDVLRAELELSRLDDRIIDMSNQHSLARAALSEWVGGEALRPVIGSLPAWTAVPPLESLVQGIQAHPVLLAADAGVGASATGVDLARQKYKSGWALDLGYSYRDGSLANGDSRSDFVNVSVTFDLPFFRRNRQDRSVAAALNQRRAAYHSREQALRRLTARLQAEYVSWNDLGRRLGLYERLILNESGNNARASLAAYQSDAGDFADLMRAYVDDLDTRLDYIRLQVKRAQSFAVLANLGGIPR